MANYVKNIIVVRGSIEALQWFKLSVSMIHIPFDFSAVIPAPNPVLARNGYCPEEDEAAMDFCRGFVTEEVQKYLKMGRNAAEFKEHGRILRMCNIGYGTTSPNEWRYRNWGTCTNAIGPISAHDGDYSIYTFTTAWAIPLPIYEKLAADFDHADLSVNVLFADEDRGYNCGFVTFQKGQLQVQYFEPSKRSKEYAKKIWDYKF